MTQEIKTMSNKLLVILLTFISFNVFGQIKVKDDSFKKIEGYVMLDKYEHTDINEAPMALIKISTENITAEQRKKFTFKGNLATFFDVHFKPGEIHLYLSAAAATFIEIIHDDYGKIEFTLPYDLCDFCGYEMVIQHIEQTPELKIGFLAISSEPDEADIYVDEKYYGKTPHVVTDLSAGHHELKLQKEGHTTLTKDIIIQKGETLKLKEKLNIANTIHETNHIVKETTSKKTTTVKYNEPKTENKKQESSSKSDVVSKVKTSTDNEIITVNGVSFTMIKVEGGTFQMGATSEQGGIVSDDERPVHSVTLSDYFIGETEVTQELWEAVMGSNPSWFKGDKKPVEQVYWSDCQFFINKLNQITGKNFRLPTEAEWEYAARGGRKSKGYKYSGGNKIGDVSCYTDNSTSTYDVKTKSPNELGIYDMSGNVSEWCHDWYGDYRKKSQTNPTGPTSGTLRTLRGGSWNSDANTCRVSYRSNGRPNYHLNTNDFTYGFRIVCTP